jgi:diadenosine tetraphosphate (Ap4A) HIT family hydrolase
MVPHLHWHLIARFENDSHFPAPVWAAALRQSDPAQASAVAARLPAVEQRILHRLQQLVSGG